jgi:uncharacterized membrane protein
MMAALIDRKGLKAETKELLSQAQVSPKSMTALYLVLLLALDMVGFFADGLGFLSTFISILATLLSWALAAGFVLYCMAIRRGERAEYLTLFDGFSFVGKVIGLNIVMDFFIFLWTMLFIIPGIIAFYRYRFALYNLYENPGIGIMEALDMSKQQTRGYKSQLFMLDLSYLGWGILASLPVGVYSGISSWQTLQSGMLDYYPSVGTIAASTLAAGSFSTSPLINNLLLSDWAWTLVIGV